MHMHREPIPGVIPLGDRVRELPRLQWGRVKHDLARVARATSICQYLQELVPADRWAVFCVNLGADRRSACVERLSGVERAGRGRHAAVAFHDYKADRLSAPLAPNSGWPSLAFES